MKRIRLTEAQTAYLYACLDQSPQVFQSCVRVLVLGHLQAGALVGMSFELIGRELTVSIAKKG